MKTHPKLLMESRVAENNSFCRNSEILEYLNSKQAEIFKKKRRKKEKTTPVVYLIILHRTAAVKVGELDFRKPCKKMSCNF